MDLATFWNVIEIMAGGCLATTFVWLQHHGAVRALSASANSALAAEWLAPLCAGSLRAGVALGGARPGLPLLRARPAPGGYLFDGTAPWVTGWDMIDLVHTLARDEVGNLVAALLPAVASASLAADRLQLAAVNASRTVELRFSAHFVPETGQRRHSDVGLGGQGRRGLATQRLALAWHRRSLHSADGPAPGGHSRPPRWSSSSRRSGRGWMPPTPLRCPQRGPWRPSLRSAPRVPWS